MHLVSIGHIILLYIVGILLGFYCNVDSLYATIFILWLLVFTKHQKMNILLLCILIVLMGNLNMNMAKQSKNIFFKDDSFVCLKGILNSRVYPSHLLSKSYNVFVLDCTDILVQGKRYPISEKIIVRLKTKNIREYCRGDHLQLFGSLQKIPGSRNPGDINRQLYWKTLKITNELLVYYEEHIKIVAKNKGCAILNFFDEIKSSYTKYLLSSLGNNAGGVAAALILGEKAFLPQDIWESFLGAGALHLLAISGFHVAIISGILLKILNGLLRNYFINLVIVVMFLIFYSILTGLHTPVVRATITISLYLIAPLFARQQSPTHILKMSVLILLCANPYNLFSIGFQFSFLICFCILWLSTNTQKKTMEQKKYLTSYIIDIIKISFIATLCSLPITAFHFQTISPIGFFSSIILYPFVYACIFGTLLLLFFPLSITIFGYYQSILLQYIYRIIFSLVYFLASIPYGYVWVLQPLTAFVISFYVFVFWMRNNKYKLFFISISCIIVLCSGYIANFRQSENEIIVLDIGHGDAIYFKQKGKHYLYDCGSNRALAFFKSSGIYSLETVILSHPDADHCRGLQILLANIHIKQIICNKAFVERGKHIIEQIESYNIPIKVVKDKESYQGFYFLYPVQNLIEPISDNDHSLGFLLRLQNKIILFLGDMEDKALQNLVKYSFPPVDILQIPHHGSYNKYTGEFLDLWHPEIALLSSTKKFPSAKVLNEYKTRNIPIWSTYEVGAINLSFEGGIIISGYSKIED